MISGGMIARIGSIECGVVEGSFTSGLSMSDQLDVTVSSSALKIDAILGEEIQLDTPEFAVDRLPTRRFSGYIFSVEETLGTNGQLNFKILAHSWMHFLSYSHGSQVNVDLSVDTILKQYLAASGLTAHQYSVASAMEKRGLCVQYEETDHDFIARLFADEGFHWYFGDAADTNKMLVQHAARPFAKKAPCNSTLSDLVFDHADTYRLTAFDRVGKAGSGSGLVSMFSVDKADRTEVRAVISNAPGGLEKAQYSMHRASRPDQTAGKVDKKQAELLVGSQAPTTKVYRGTCAHPNLYVGEKVSIDSGSLENEVTSVYITWLCYRLGIDGDWHVDFQAINSKETLYPSPRAKPVLAGVHSAIVDGTKAKPANDKDHSVPVIFPWDRMSKKAKPTPHIRVASLFAGAERGVSFLPRAGDEVLVSFINGDPDAPVVVGSVHNSKTKPWTKASSTRSGITTLLDGGTNSLLFDDKKGAENITLSTAGQVDLIAETNLVEKVTKDASLEAENIVENAKTDHRVTAEAIAAEASKEYKITTGTFDVDASKAAKIDADALTLAIAKAIKASGASIEFNADQSIKLKANSGIELAVGGNSIKVSASGIAINGMKVDVAAKTTASLKGLTVNVGAQTKVTVKGSAMAEIGGGLTSVGGALVKLG